MSDAIRQIASYFSRCKLCDEAIHPGEEIALYDPEGLARWCHVQCVQNAGQDEDDYQPQTDRGH